MKRNNKRLIPSAISSKVESGATAAANYANGDGMLEASEMEEDNGGKAFYRLPRRLNSSLLKTISRKLPCLNHRHNSSSSREGVGFSEMSQTASITCAQPDINFAANNAKERSNNNSSRQAKTKNRAICPIMPSPTRLTTKNCVDKLNVNGDTNLTRKPSVSLVSSRHSDVVSSAVQSNDVCSSSVPEIISAKLASDEVCYAAAAVATSSGFPQVPKNSSSHAYIEVYPSPKTRSITMELYRLAKYGWYWGPISRSEAEERLHGQPDGAFLVRDSSDDRYLLSLSFRSFDKTLHTRIEHSNGMFSFYVQPESESHASVVELIEHSMSYSQSGVFCYSKARTPGAPSYPVRLTRPVSRFTQVRSLQYLCRFVIRQYTRVDLIQDLPLPNRIKGYIKEAHY